MRFQSPGGSLSWLTPIICLAAGFLAFNAVAKNEFIAASLYGIASVCCVLVWFRVRWAGAVLLAYFAFAFVVGVYMLATVQFDGRKAFRVLTLGFLVHELWQWYVQVGREKQLARLEAISTRFFDRPDGEGEDDEDLPDRDGYDGVDDPPPTRREDRTEHAADRFADPDDPFGDRWRDA